MTSTTQNIKRLYSNIYHLTLNHMRLTSLLRTVLLVSLLMGGPPMLIAQDRSPNNNVIYPDRAFVQNGGRVIDVTQPPYNAAGDGITDDTEAIVAAYNTIADSLREYGWQGTDNIASYLLYFPNGTYLVSNTLIHDGEINYDTAQFGTNTGPEGLARLRIVGQSRTNTIIRLADNSPGFEAGAEKEVISFQKKNVGDREGTNVPGSNQLSDITINTGSGNPGAIGVLYITANIGEISNVEIKSEDGQGFTGLDMPFFSEQGYYRDITIEGFDNGIRVVSPFATNPTLEYLTLRNQNSNGILVIDGSPSIRKLESINTVPAITMTADQAQVVLIDSELKGGSASNSAIDYQDTVSQLFVRNVQVTGYGSAIRKAGTDVVTGNVDEYVSNQVYTLFEGVEEKSLNLPVAESLLLEWEQDTAQWANVDDYTGTNDSERIQNAMNSGKPVVYFPKVKYNLTTEVTIPPSVRHINFMYTRPERAGASTQFVISEGSDEPLFMDHAQGRGILRQSAPRPVVMRNQNMEYAYTSDQPNELYLESVATVGDVSDFCPPSLTTWGRSVNNEIKTTSNFKVFGGTMWVLGYKTEGQQASFEVTDGGVLEVLGGFRNETVADEGLPIVINDSSTVSFVGYSNLGDPYEVVITETQSGITQRLLESDVPRRPFRNVFVPLYVGRAGATAPACLAPDQISAAPGLTDVQLFWQVRNDLVNSYEVRYRQLSTTTWLTATGSGDTTSTITGLTAGLNYEWQVRVKCGEGTSDWSSPGEFTTSVGAKNASTALTIDGALDEKEWEVSVAATKLANGTINNTLTFGVLWDETYLYVGANVLDDSLINDSDRVFQDDAVEVYLDVNNNGGAYDSTDNQLIKGYNDTTLLISRTLEETVLHEWAPVAGGYSVELAIPWAGLGVTPAAGLTIGFSIGADDDDDGGDRDGQQVWAGNASNFNNTSGFGDIILQGGGNTPTDTLSGVYKLLARHSGKALTVDLNEQTNGGFSDATADGVNVFQFGTNDDENRLWDVRPVADGYYQLISVYSGKALAVDLNEQTNGGFSNARANGVNVFQFGTNERSNRLWRIEEIDSGYYQLTNKFSGKVLDVFKSDTTDGANVQQWSPGGQANKQWQLVPVDTTALAQVGDCRLMTQDFPGAAQIVAVSEVSYADFSRNNSSYVVGIATGIREDGLAGAWEIHNDCSVKTIRRTGQGDNTTRLPNVRGLERNRGWNYLPDSISADGQYIFATAVNEGGFTHARGWTIAPGTTLAVRFQLGGPFYGRIFGVSSDIRCDDLLVETFAGNFFVTGCGDRCDNAARTAVAGVKSVTKPDSQGANPFRTYPNPASEQLTVEGSEDYQVTLYDLTGRMMLQHEHLSGNAELDIRHLRPGLYLVKLRDGGQREVRQRIVVE